MATSTSPAFTTYGATATTFITTTISLSASEASFTILYPLPATEAVQYTTFPAVEEPSNTYTPSPLPILFLTNVVGIAVNPSGSPVATRTLKQTPPPQPTNTSTSAPQAAACASWKWTCWPLSKQVGIGLAIGLGTLLLVLFLWWLFFWRPRIRKIRIRRGRPGDEEGGERRPPLKIAVRTSMSQTRRRSQGARDGSLSPSPPPPERGSGGVRVVTGITTGNGGVKDPPAYRVVRQPSPREYVRPVSMPDGPMRGDADGIYETRVRDFAVPAAAAVGAGVNSAARSRREGRSGGVRVSRGESSRDSRGSRRERRDPEAGIEMRERSERQGNTDGRERDEHDMRRSRSHREREEEYDGRRGDGRSRRNSYAARDEEDFEVRRDRNPRRRSSERDGAKRRPRSVSPPSRDRWNGKQDQKKRRDSEGGVGNMLKKILPFVPLVLGLMSTIGEPKGGWNQYIPEDKRKKSKVKKMAEDAFDKHHHKIPEDFPRHLHQRSPRSKSADRAYRSTKPHYSPLPRRREDRHRSKNINNDKHRRGSAHPVGNMREAFNSITPEAGSAHTSPSPSPPPRRKIWTRGKSGRRGGGYDGADDETFVVHSANTVDGNAGETLKPYEIFEPESPILRSARTFPLHHESEKRGAYGIAGYMPPTPPSIVR